MEDLVGGSCAGMHAGKWIKNKNFSGTESLNEALFSANAKISDLISNANTNNTSSISNIKSKLWNSITTNMGFERSSEGLQNAAKVLENLEVEIHKEELVDGNMIMNTNLMEILELRGLISVARASIIAAQSRSESRGSHQRTDFQETVNETMLKHTLVDSAMQINWLPLRKSGSGSWILTPTN